MLHNDNSPYQQMWNSVNSKCIFQRKIIKFLLIENPYEYNLWIIETNKEHIAINYYLTAAVNEIS
jgi:hypothetical protein